VTTWARRLRDAAKVPWGTHGVPGCKSRREPRLVRMWVLRWQFHTTPSFERQSLTQAVTDGWAPLRLCQRVLLIAALMAPSGRPASQDVRCPTRDVLSIHGPDPLAICC